jgi:hypothetical protein
MARRPVSKPKPNLADIWATRQKFSALNRSRSSAGGEDTSGQRAIQKLVMSTLTKAGFDLKKFEALLKQSDAELRARMAERKAKAAKEYSAMLPTIETTLNNWRYSPGQFVNALPAVPAEYIFLDTASEIAATPLIPLTSSNIAPRNNWAQFEFDATDVINSDQNVSFAFSWENASDSYALLNADGYLVLNGDIQSVSDGGIFADFNYCDMYIDVYLYIHGLRSSEPNIGTEQAGQHQSALSLVNQTSGFFASTSTINQHLFRGYDLRYTLLQVPPNQTVLFEVAVYLTPEARGGRGKFTFQGQNRQVLCPGVLLHVLG